MGNFCNNLFQNSKPLKGVSSMRWSMAVVRWLMAVAVLMSTSAVMATPALHLGVAPLTQKVFRDSEVGALLKGVTVSLSGDLVGPGAVRIAADRVALMKVAYVTAPGRDKYYPDPLPPLQGDFEVLAGENQPIWVKVSIPQYCTPGRAL